VEKNKALWLLAIYFCLSVYLLPMFPHGGSANELTRWAAAASIIEKGSFEISWTEDLIGKNVDTARVGERVYSNKAPGTALLAAPVYGLTRIFTGAPDASNIRVSWLAMRFTVSTLPLLFLAIWLYRRETDMFSLAALLFATPLFLYSLLLFSHVLVAVLIYFAFRLLYDAKKNLLRNYFSAGFLCGLAVICEFPVIFAAAVFGAGLFFTEKRGRSQRLMWFAAGGLPFVIFLLVYNYALFGSPVALSYAYESFPEWAEVAGQGVFGIGFPTVSNIYLLLFSPARGLFFYSPVLILSVVCFFTSPERKTLRHKIKICTIAIAVLLMCGHGAAHGGWAFGARYLVFVLPLMLDSFFDGEIYGFSNLWQGFLFTASFLFCTIPALTFPFAPPEFRFPHNDFWWKFLLVEGWFTPNLADVFGLSSGFWTILPVALALFAAFFIVWRNARRPNRFAVGILAGLLVTGVYSFLLHLDNAENEFRRATIAERFFMPASRLEKFRENAKAQNDWQFLQRINDFEWIIADARAVAPNDFPYLATRTLKRSPTAELKKVLELQKQGNTAEAEAVLQKGKEDFPFVRCEFSTNLAVIFYTTDRKEAALQELESVQPLVNNASRPDCLRAQYLLGTLYQETGRNEDAQKTFRAFWQNSENSNDAEIKSYRQKLSAGVNSTQ
jgi:4-amino-4-deoxy-L-arabinose transferase-like glycosyltransferase